MGPGRNLPGMLAAPVLAPREEPRCDGLQELVTRVLGLPQESKLHLA